MSMSPVRPWKSGHQLELLENGESFYPRVFESIRAAQREVLLETFILFDDKVGRELREVLIDAARRGVRVAVTVDGYGSPDLSEEFVHGLTEAGVQFLVFDPQPPLLGMRTNLFRRLHRKLVVIDERIAFVGGINFSLEHLAEFGAAAKQDYAVQLEGPVVQDIHRFMLDAAGLEPLPPRRLRLVQRAAPAEDSLDGAMVRFVTRDNTAHRTDIEQQYLAALRGARRQVLIANAYFFPGYRVLRELRNAARRGVDVRLILQGEPDMAIAQIAGRTLYDYLLRDGVRVYEYCRRPLHAKVAVIDDEWVTVGSSNLDPLSLSLNLEANVVIRDARFAHHLRRRLAELIHHHCREMGPQHRPRPRWWQLTVGTVVFHVLRRFPAWAGWLPAHRPRIASPPLPAAAGEPAPHPETPPPRAAGKGG